MAAPKHLGKTIRELKAKGFSYNQIAHAVGTSKGNISYHLGLGQKAKTKTRTTALRGTIDKYVRHQKETNPCSDCGQFYAYYILEYDHRPDFVKLFGIANYKTYTNSIDVVKAEMAKCDLVCANCHRTREHWRRVEKAGMLESYEEHDF